MDGQARDDQIKRAVGERQMPHVCRVQRHAVGDSFPFRILLGYGKSITRLLVGVPDIDSSGGPSGKKVGSHQQHGPTTAPEIKGVLIS